MIDNIKCYSISLLFCFTYVCRNLMMRLLFIMQKIKLDISMISIYEWARLLFKIAGPYRGNFFSEIVIRISYFFSQNTIRTVNVDGEQRKISQIIPFSTDFLPSFTIFYVKITYLLLSVHMMIQMCSFKLIKFVIVKNIIDIGPKPNGIVISIGRNQFLKSRCEFF